MIASVTLHPPGDALAGARAADGAIVALLALRLVVTTWTVLITIAAVDVGNAAISVRAFVITRLAVGILSSLFKQTQLIKMTYDRNRSHRFDLGSWRSRRTMHVLEGNAFGCCLFEVGTRSLFGRL